MSSLLVGLLLLAGPASVAASEALWDALKAGGQVVLLRHATTVPGFADPPGFSVEDCASQRNLSDQGRQEARRLGAAFRALASPPPAAGNIILVTHGINIAAAIGIRPAQGEMIVITPHASGTFAVRGRISPP
jgi:broad specificity phosphatase PhoE